MSGTIQTWKDKRHELIGKARKTTEDGDTCEHGGKVKPCLIFRRPPSMAGFWGNTTSKIQRVYCNLSAQHASVRMDKSLSTDFDVCRSCVTKLSASAA